MPVVQSEVLYWIESLSSALRAKGAGILVTMVGNMKLRDRLMVGASLMMKAKTPLSDGTVSASDKNEDT